MSIASNDPYDTREYREFVEDMVRFCRCSPPYPCPCDGVLAGGMCDDLGNGPEDDRDDDLDEETEEL